jgi:Porin subfamily
MQPKHRASRWQEKGKRPLDLPFCIRSAEPITLQSYRTVGAMRTLQTLLFGVAAGLLASGAAAAAEQNAKPKPAGHVKNCSVYGAGFHYVPDADLCMKIGGWTRAQASSGAINWSALNSNPASSGATSARGYVTTDVRKQTEYGTVRAYVSVGASHQ